MSTFKDRGSIEIDVPTDKPAGEIELQPITINLAFGNKWKRSVKLPAKGKFVEESHYATTEDTFPGGNPFPATSFEGIDAHLDRSFQILKAQFPDAIKGAVYKQSWQKQWTPPEGGKAGQAARGSLKPTPDQEMWQGNMMFAKGELPKPGTKFLMRANGKSCVIQMGFEIGPGAEKFLGGVTREVHWYLGTGNESEIEIALLKDQGLPLGPLKEAMTSAPAPAANPDLPIVLPEPMDDQPPWMAIAKAELGVREGVNDKRIVEYHQATSLKAPNSGVAWCSSFVNWVMKQAGIQGTNSAWARDWLKWGMKLDTPRPGCICVIERNGPGGDSHVFFWLGEKDGFVTALGGNQHDMVCETQYAKSLVLGYRWPAG